MLRLLDCLQNEHDWRLVVLAVAVCCLTSFAGINTFQRAVGNGRPSAGWLLTSGIMTGCGIWATHFIAILAFTPGFDNLDIALTALSLAFAVAMVTAGFAVALFSSSALAALVGGLAVGSAIAVMHYTGIAALDMPDVIGWSFPQFVASIVLGQVFGILAMLSVGHRQGVASLIAGGTLLAIAIVAHHFVGMSAMIIHQGDVGFVVPEGARIWLSIAITLVMAAVIVACTISAVIDRRAHRRLAERNMQLDAALTNMSQGLCLFDETGRLRLCNPRFLEIYGLRQNAALPGTTIQDLDAARRVAGTRFLHGGGSPEQRDAANQTIDLQDGRTVSIQSRPLPDGGWVVTHSDITQRRRDEARIEHMAQHDPLTGLANRSAFNDRLALAIQQTRENDAPFALICVDLDHFKQVNDLFGHAVGDDLLHAAAERLHIAAGGAFTARLASDEFVIISTAGKQPTTAEDICARITAAFVDDFLVNGVEVPATCSVGVSIFPQDAGDAETLRMHADVALRRAKTRDTGAVCFFEPKMDEEARERRELQRDLAAAVAAEQLELYYQPQADRTGEIVSFEVLVRWVDRKRGTVLPDVFIPVAEELGLIGAIDAWVLRKACREAVSWERPLSIAVNLSASSFESGDVGLLIESALHESGLEHSRLEIEITESVLIDDFKSVSTLLHSIKRLGVRIAMDDFGTGYSSLSYLQSFPFDKLKIDKSFIRDDDTNATSPLIVKAIIGLGHALRMTVLAEGVETKVQRDFLVQSGCDELQGYMIGRPKPVGHYRSHFVTTREAPNSLAV